MNYKINFEEYSDYVKELYREFHRHPELSGEEVWTSSRICKELELLEIPYTVLDKRNVVGVIDSKRIGKNIAVRADFDALPVKEETGLPYASEYDGKMHACGHDAHTAMLLGAARILKENEDMISGKVYLCFQMGEEVGEGAYEIVEYLKGQEKIDQVFGMHIAAIIPKGYIALSEGPIMAGAYTWKIEVNGKGGHGSMPDKAIDPIRPAAEIMMRITSLLGNKLDPLDPVVISTGMFNAGTKANIIPEKASLEGTIRYFRQDTREKVFNMIEDISDKIASSYGTSAKVSYIQNASPVTNNSESIAIARKAVSSMDNLQYMTMPKLMGSDNFSDFVNTFDGFYAFIGAGFDGENGMLFNHNPRFTLDEDAFIIGSEFIVRTISEMME